jgi:Dolichyl-phosphate-mannose-protein mannosyltransferase
LGYCTLGRGGGTGGQAMKETAGTERHPLRGIILLMAGLALAMHLVANGLGGYGYFRDELYYIACSKRLAAGYVDQTPLSIFMLAGVRSILGESIFAIRFVPAVLSGVSVALLGLLVRRMGGGRAAIVLASLAFVSAPYLMGSHAYFSMNSFDVMFWLVAVHALLGASESRRLRWWLLLGLALGLGLLNKTSVFWLCAGIGAAILLSGRLRSQLGTRGPYTAAALAIALFSPFIIWNALHGWPHLEFILNATEGKYSSLTRGRFLMDQFLAMNPVTYLISLPGLVWCFTQNEGSRRRFIGITFLVVFGILFANPHSKSEYIAAAYPMLFACGGVAVEQMRRPWRVVVTWALSGLLVVSGAILAPLAIPLLPVNTYLGYSRALGVAPSTSEAKELSDLPQFFADMHGWEELAQNVSKAYLTIPESERLTTVAFVTNYGEAGALEFFADRYPLPRVICIHNSYWLWGVGQTPVTTFIRLGGNREDYYASYSDVTPAGVHICSQCMPYENNLNIFIVRDRHVPIESAWAEYKHFE